MAFSEENNSSYKLDEPHIFIDKSGHKKTLENTSQKGPKQENEIMLYPTLNYINKILLEEGLDELFTGYQQVAALSDIEKPFYDILGKKYPPSPINQSVSSLSQLSHTSTISLSNDQVLPSSTCKSSTKDTRIESMLAKEFLRGVEEGKKFLPTINNLAIDLNVSRLSLDSAQKKDNKLSKFELEKERAHDLVDRRKGRKNSNTADSDPLEGQNSKRPVLYTEEIIRDEMFNKVVLYQGEDDVIEEISRLRDIMKCAINSYSDKNENKDQVIDLGYLLIQCSEAVAHNKYKTAEKLINKIRKRASPSGNGAERLACILTDGLEARLAGTGSEIYRRLVNRRISIRRILKAFRISITAAPFLRVSYCFANGCILKAVGNASRIHIIDLGIGFGLQWPPLIQALSKRDGGAPKLRITGVDLPQPGFRPDEQIKQIGVRLEECARSFGVPFEYQCIASLWESICIADLKIDDGEVLIVNSLLRFALVRDETFAMDSPRNQVLNLIRQLKPKIFVIGIFNASFSPFFLTRFRNVLLHYSMLFDMIDTIIPRDDEGRQLIERELIAPPIINQVACEGPGWVERPETYKQWHKRILWAGFEQLPMNRDIVEDCNKIVKSGYHEEFFIEEDSGWLLHHWKGRINYGFSTWKPKLY